MDAGDFDSARSIVTASTAFTGEEKDQDLAYLDREEENHHRAQISARYEIQAVDDPKGVMEQLLAKDQHGIYQNNPAMDETERKRLILAADRRTAAKRQDQFNDLKAAIEAPGGIPQGDIARLGDYLTEGDQLALRTFRSRVTPPTPEDNLAAHDQILLVRDAHARALQGELDPKDYLNTFSDARSVIITHLPSGYSGPILDTLDRFSPAKLYDPATRGKPPTPAERIKDIEIEVDSRLNAAYRQHYFGRTDRYALPLEKDDAARHQHDLRDLILDDIRSRKDLTKSQARDLVDHHLSGLRAEKTASGISLPGTRGSRPPVIGPASRPPSSGRRQRELRQEEAEKFLRDHGE